MCIRHADKTRPLPHDSSIDRSLASISKWKIKLKCWCTVGLQSIGWVGYEAQWEGSLALLFLQEVSSSGEKNNELPGWMGSWIY